MVESDAGTYEVKISSISYDSDDNESPYCDSLVLSLLELTAPHAPVTFIVQEQCLPVYDLSPAVSTHYVVNTSGITSVECIELGYNIPLNVSSESVHIYWYRNGIRTASKDS